MERTFLTKPGKEANMDHGEMYFLAQCRYQVES